jgi:hypothetical protein
MMLMLMLTIPERHGLHHTPSPSAAHIRPNNDTNTGAVHHHHHPCLLPPPPRPPITLITTILIKTPLRRPLRILINNNNRILIANVIIKEKTRATTTRLLLIRHMRMRVQSRMLVLVVYLPVAINTSEDRRRQPIHAQYCRR